MRRVIGALALVVLCVASALAAYETYSGRDAAGNTYTKLKNTSVSAPYSYWAWTISPAGKGNANATGGNASNAETYQTHHRMIVGGSYVPIARVDLLHTNTGTDTLRFMVYCGAVADSLKWICSTVSVVSFPVTGDSIAFAPHQTSAAGDWYITTYFER